MRIDLAKAALRPELKDINAISILIYYSGLLKENFQRGFLRFAG
jgi:hypothetical protein